MLQVTNGMLDQELAYDAAQMIPFLSGCIPSFVTLAKNKSWLWFCGLAWGACTHTTQLTGTHFSNSV